MIKKGTAILLALMLVLGLVPSTAFACEVTSWSTRSDNAALKRTDNAVLVEGIHSQQESSISVGDYIMLGTYLGEDILWRCIGIDENGPLMLSDKIICFKAYDASGESAEYHTDPWGYVRKERGSNCWYDSSLRQWLNSNEETVTYSHCPPVEGKVTENPYADEAGFLTCFTDEELKVVRSVSHKVYLNDCDVSRGYSEGGSTEIPTWTIDRYSSNIDYSGYYHHYVSDRILLLSAEQIGMAHDNLAGYLDKTHLSDAAATSIGLSPEDLESFKNAAFAYWTSIPCSPGASYENVVTGPSSHSYGRANDGAIGVRPAFYLNTEADVDIEIIPGEDVKSGFRLGIDNNRFMHTSNQEYGNAGFVGVKDYTISDEYFKRLTECSSKGEINSMKKNMKDDWEGSCYGIAMTMGLLYEDYLDMSDLTNSNASTYYSLDYPYRDPQFLNVINYFQLSKSLTIGGREHAAVSTTCSNGWFTGLMNWLYDYDSLAVFLQKLVSYCSNGHILVFGYNTKTSGHAILVTGCAFDDTTQEYVIEIYDENTVSPLNTLGSFGEMRVSKDYSEFTYRDPYDQIKLSNDKYCTMYFLNWDSLESIVSSLTTEQQNRSSEASGILNVQAADADYAILEFPLDGDGFTISNVNGEYLSYNGASFYGTLPIYSVSTEEYDTESRIRIETENSKTFIVTDAGDEFELEVYDNDDFMSLTGSNISYASLDTEKGIEIEGNQYSFKTYISTDEVAPGEDGLVSVSANAECGSVTVEANGTTVTVNAEAVLTDVSTETYIGTESYIQDYEKDLTDLSIESTDTTTNRLRFADVTPSDYYYEPVLWALGEGITDGVTETEFAPEDTCKRSQVVTFLWRAAGEPKAASRSNPFVDVKSTDYFYEAVLWAVEKGITDGMDETHFEPDGVCNRSQVVTFLYRAFKEPPVGSASNPFTDVPANKWYATPVLWAVKEGITDGVTETSFAPEKPCTRGQVVTFLYRAYVN